MKLEKNWKEGKDSGNRICVCSVGTISGSNNIKID
jgi:hypothetical protein